MPGHERGVTAAVAGAGVAAAAGAATGSFRPRMRRRFAASPASTIVTEITNISVPTTFTCMGTPRWATPQTYKGNVVVVPELRLVTMKSSKLSEKASKAAPRMPGKTSGKVTFQKVCDGVA